MIVYRKKQGRGFSYADAEGRSVDAETKVWIKALAIPPAWQDVEVNTDKDAKVWAYGRDGKGKKQYIYNSHWREIRDEEKFERMLPFCNALGRIRRRYLSDLSRPEPGKEKALACMTRLLELTYFRPGCLQYQRSNNSFGLTTLRSKHLAFLEEGVEITFMGKSKVLNSKQVTDELVCSAIEEFDDLPGREVFTYLDANGEKTVANHQDLNDYIRGHMGEQFSAKDFRTWGGTLVFAKNLAKMGAPASASKRNKNLVAAAKLTAKSLGNTPAIARSSYIHPKVEQFYKHRITLGDFSKFIKRTPKSLRLNREEKMLRLMLQA